MKEKLQKFFKDHEDEAIAAATLAFIGASVGLAVYATNELNRITDVAVIDDVNDGMRYMLIRKKSQRVAIFDTPLEK